MAWMIVISFSSPSSFDFSQQQQQQQNSAGLRVIFLST